MSDWGHEGHMGPRQTYCTLTRAREADNGILVAPKRKSRSFPPFLRAASWPFGATCNPLLIPKPKR